MLLDRADRVVSICEMKYSDGDYLIDKEEEARIRQRLEVFRRCACRRRSVQMVLITSCGLKRNTHSGIVQNVVVADDLFR